jgi:S1-C subfamily serine protease
MQPGDILLSLAGEKLDERTPLIRALSHHQVGQRLAAEVWRDGATQTIDVTLEELPR